MSACARTGCREPPVVANGGGRRRNPMVAERTRVQSAGEKLEAYLQTEVDRMILAMAYLLLLIAGKGRSPDQTIKDFGLKEASVLKHLFALGRAGVLEKNTKLFCAWPMARLLGETLPAAHKGENYEFLFGKQVRSFLRSRVPNGGLGKPTTERARKVAYSVLLWKDCMVEVPESFVEASFDDYKTTLTTPPPEDLDRFYRWREGRREERRKGIWTDGEWYGTMETELEEYELLNELIEKSIDKTVNEVFKPVDPRHFKDDEVVPSCSSSFERGRNDGGAWQELVESQGFYNPLSDDTLHSMHFHPREGVKVVRSKPAPIVGKFADKKVKARIAPILEACKVRWVSIGESKEYFRAKAWNRLVYAQMPNHPTFRLTGHPCGVDDVDIMTGDFLLSGDYKGATDTLDPTWSTYVLDRITARLYKRDRVIGPDYRIIGLRQMLVGHTMEYTHGKGKEKRTETFDQANGQLMGSYLSFPVLCILNAAINRVYLDPSLEKPIAELPLRINGDDVLMSAEEPFQEWASTVALVGLTPSVGKNYVHQFTCCVNSEFYTRPRLGGSFKRDRPWRISLIFGQSARTESSLWGRQSGQPNGSDRAWEVSLGSKARELCAYESGEVKAAMLSAFIRENLGELKKTERSWWVPEQLGGLGLPLDESTVKLISPEGRKIATYLLTRPDPRDRMIYAPRGTTDTTLACANWMAACEVVLKSRHYTYTWLSPEEEDAPPPLGLVPFLGYGCVAESKPSNNSRYNKVRKLAKEASLKPVSDEKLIAFSRAQPKAGWVRSLIGRKTAQQLGCTVVMDEVVICDVGDSELLTDVTAKLTTKDDDDDVDVDRTVGRESEFRPPPVGGPSPGPPSTTEGANPGFPGPALAEEVTPPLGGCK